MQITLLQMKTQEIIFDRKGLGDYSPVIIHDTY